MSNQAKRISDFEMTFPASFSDVEEREFGKLYYCREMPDLYDGNHAVISNCNNYDTILNEICCFYNNLRLSPRIYSNWHGGNLYEIKEYLLNHGFSLAVYDDVVIMTLENPNYDFESSLLKIRKVTELDKTIKDIYLKQYKGTTENIYKREILLRNPHVNFFAGYNKDNLAVSIGAIEHNSNGVARITDIITHPNFRNKGYASELISYLVTYTRQLPVDLVYLDTDNPIAMNIYKKCGFNILQDNFQFWVAHK